MCTIRSSVPRGWSGTGSDLPGRSGAEGPAGIGILFSRFWGDCWERLHRHSRITERWCSLASHHWYADSHTPHLTSMCVQTSPQHLRGTFSVRVHVYDLLSWNNMLPGIGAFHRSLTLPTHPPAAPLPETLRTPLRQHNPCNHPWLLHGIFCGAHSFFSDETSTLTPAWLSRSGLEVGGQEWSYGALPDNRRGETGIWCLTRPDSPHPP